VGPERSQTLTKDVESNSARMPRATSPIA
jgi:hypothetical protein